MRQLKYHEQKLLKKANFEHWHSDPTNALRVIRRYYLKDRQEYTSYNQLLGNLKQIAHKLSLLDREDPYRKEMTMKILNKLYAMGFINKIDNLSQVEHLTVPCIAKRRLAIMMVHLKMAERPSHAHTLIQQGHVRVGPNVITDPAYLIVRDMEEYITWRNGKIRKVVDEYNNERDDYAE